MDETGKQNVDEWDRNIMCDRTLPNFLSNLAEKKEKYF